jgi:hypothetical protein
VFSLAVTKVPAPFPSAIEGKAHWMIPTPQQPDLAEEFPARNDRSQPKARIERVPRVHHPFFPSAAFHYYPPRRATLGLPCNLHHPSSNSIFASKCREGKHVPSTTGPCHCGVSCLAMHHGLPIMDSRINQQQQALIIPLPLSYLSSIGPWSMHKGFPEKQGR